MHPGDEVVHLLESGVARADDGRITRIERAKFVVGDDDRDLDEFVDREVEPRHFAVDPDQSVVFTRTHGHRLAPLARGRLFPIAHFSVSVPPAGFEPATKRLEGSCSIP
jgi:hypothetical protein